VKQGLNAECSGKLTVVSSKVGVVLSAFGWSIWRKESLKAFKMLYLALNCGTKFALNSTMENNSNKSTEDNLSY